jgi:hypothetical protein
MRGASEFSTIFVKLKDTSQVNNRALIKTEALKPSHLCVSGRMDSDYILPLFLTLLSDCRLAYLDADYIVSVITRLIAEDFAVEMRRQYPIQSFIQMRAILILQVLPRTLN